VSEPPQDSEQQPEAQLEVGSVSTPRVIQVRQEADEAPRPKTIEETKEQVRGQITGWSIFTFILTIILGFVGVFTGYWADAKELLMIVIPIEGTLIGGIAGYYLGTGRQA
jgi:hypothetical protein